MERVTLASSFGIIALAISSPGWATRVVGNETAVQSSVVNVINESKQALAIDLSVAGRVDGNMSLREGTVMRITTLRNQIEINGSWLKIDPIKTRLIRQGRAVTTDALVVGQLLKFTVRSAGPEAYTLGVIYVP